MNDVSGLDETALVDTLTQKHLLRVAGLAGLPLTESGLDPVLRALPKLRWLSLARCEKLSARCVDSLISNGISSLFFF